MEGTALDVVGTAGAVAAILGVIGIVVILGRMPAPANSTQTGTITSPARDAAKVEDV
jgi:hypothetical protein